MNDVIAGWGDVLGGHAGHLVGFAELAKATEKRRHRIADERIAPRPADHRHIASPEHWTIGSHRQRRRPAPRQRYSRLAGRHQELRPDYRPNAFRRAKQNGRRVEEYPRADYPDSAPARRSPASRQTDVPDRADPRRYFGRRQISWLSW